MSNGQILRCFQVVFGSGCILLQLDLRLCSLLLYEPIFANRSR